MNLVQPTTILVFGFLPAGPSQPIPPPPIPVPSFPGIPPPSTEFSLINAEQSGQVTPGHLAAWVTDNVLADAGVQFNNTFGKFVTTLQNVNFNLANHDNAVPINIPLGYTRYRLEQIIISGASAPTTIATCGVFTQPGATGTVIVSSNSPVVIQIGGDALNNIVTLGINNSNIIALNDPIIYFRTQTPQGSAVTASVSVFYQPLP